VSAARVRVRAFGKLVIDAAFRDATFEEGPNASVRECDGPVGAGRGGPWPTT
jgi:hypothetical protein